MRKEVIASIVVALLTTGSAPWWWDKAFGTKEAPAAPAEPREPSERTRAAPQEPSDPNERLVPDTPIRTPPLPTAEPAPSPAETTEPPPALTHCEGKWFVQMGAGTDKDGLIGVVQKIRAVGGKFSDTGLFTSESGNYRVVLGCFTRFEADALKEELEAKGVLEKTPLVTQGKLLRDRVY